MVVFRCFLTSFLLLFFAGASVSQEFYVVAPDLKKVSLGSAGCSSTNISSCISTAGFSVTMYKDTIYTIDLSKNLIRSVIVNGVETSCKVIAQLGGFYNSLTVDSAGMLYGASLNAISRIDAHTGQVTFIGFAPFYSAGDMLFYGNDLYMAAASPNEGIVKLNLQNLALSEMFIPLKGLEIYGLVNIAVECNKNKVVAVEWSGSRSNLIELDMVNRKVLGTICSLPYQVYDAASAVETGTVASITIDEIKQSPECRNSLLSGGLNIKCASGVGTYTYTLNNGVRNNTGKFTGLPAGDYAIHINSSLGCVRDTFASISTADTSQFSVMVTDALCTTKTGTMTINTSAAGSPFLYSLNMAPIQASNSFLSLSKGDYFVQVSDRNNCASAKMVTINAITPGVAQTINLMAATCGLNNGKLLVSTIGDIRGYSINNRIQQTAGLFENLTNGDYLVSSFTTAGCRYDTVVHMTRVPQSIPSIEVRADAPTCFDREDGIVTLIPGNASSLYTISFNGSGFSSKYGYSNLGSGRYAIKIKDAQNCILDTAAVVPAYLNRTPAHTTDSENPTCWSPLSGSTRIGVTGEVAPYSISYLNKDYGSSHQFRNLSPGIYHFKIFDKNYCPVDSISQSLELIMKTGRCDAVVVPNAFTPNRDFTNDLFKAKAFGILKAFSMSIYNRYGQLVFSATDINAGWDGMFNGNEQPSGTFVWMVNYTMADDRKRSLKGTVVLSR